MEGNEASDDEMVKQCGNDSKKRKSFGRMKEPLEGGPLFWTKPMLQSAHFNPVQFESFILLEVIISDSGQVISEHGKMLLCIKLSLKEGLGGKTNDYHQSTLKCQTSSTFLTHAMK
ncbi:hypothetical protein J6590_040912, partial [Homalodisca vitripennis]